MFTTLTQTVPAASVPAHTAHPQTPAKFMLFTVIAALTAAIASWATEAVHLEVWVMFAGFIAWFTRPASPRDGIAALICLWLGIGLAALAYRATGAFIPSLGSLALPLVVFFAGLLVVGLRTTAIVNNMPAWFLGLVTFFAAESGISVEAIAQLAAASAVGGFAGWVCVTLNRRWAE